MAAKTQKKSVSLTDSDAQTFLEGEENNILKEKPKVKYSAALVLAFSRLRMKIDNWKICLWPILAIYLIDFFCR